jgi:two-component system, OmpR family, sensor histidine kinase MtrB
MALTTVTYTVARAYLLDQRSAVATAQAYANASAARDELRKPVNDIFSFMNSIVNDEDEFAVLQRDTRQFPQRLEFQTKVFPQELREEVLNGGTGQQQFTYKGTPYLAIGVTIRESGAHFFQAFSLKDTDRALRDIGAALLIGTAINTLIAAAFGWWTSRRLLKPVSRVSAAAAGIASGGFDIRLAPESDPELNRLAQSFNEMAGAVQTRIERDVRFASDVSHELRSPITALSAAVEVLNGRREDLPDRSKQALDVVVDQVRRFDQMVMDLLELSRIDAGVTDLHREELQLDDVVPRIAQRYGFGEVPIDVRIRPGTNVWIDKLRLERIVANLLDNARQHGGGPTKITIDADKGGGFLLAVEDAGPGVARGERVRIFERFARGTAGRHRVGTGLGLALVAEHAQAHGGEAWVEDRVGGGARFVVRLPNIRGKEQK